MISLERSVREFDAPTPQKGGVYMTKAKQSPEFLARMARLRERQELLGKFRAEFVVPFVQWGLSADGTTGELEARRNELLWRRDQYGIPPDDCDRIIDEVTATLKAEQGRES